jgi:hypothetical protein
MKRFLFIAALAAFAAPSFAADVGVSVNIGQPGFYGQIDIGGFPRPRVIYAQPVIVEHTIVTESPVYLRVPPGHRKKWSKHCGEYNACGRQVYFVSDTWYNREYAPRYQREHGDHDDGDKHDRGDRGDDHGHDKGHGKGKKGHGRD